MKPVSILLALILAATALVGPTAPAARADDADTGVAIASGLAIAVVAVYALVGLQSDVERYSDSSRPADIESAIARASAAAERTPITAVPVTLSPEWSSASTEVAGAALALRTTF